MVLYHVISSYHLLNAMVHSSLHKEESTIIVSEWLVEKFPQIKKLEYFFDEIIIMDANYCFLHTDSETNEYVTSIVMNRYNFSKIYVWGAHFTFGFFLAKNNIPYIYCEDAAGLMSRPQIVEAIDKNDPLKGRYYNILKDLGLYNAEKKYIQKIVCNVSAQETTFGLSEKIINFNVIRELKNLNENQRKQIITFFLVDQNKIAVDKDAVVLLTQHFVNLKVLSFEQQVLIYQIFVDYFLKERALLIKTHPDDLMYYKQIFPEAQVIHEKFPSEFIPFVFDNEPNCVATISSTAIYNLRELYCNNIELDTRFENMFEMTHRYYTAVKIAEELDLDIICYGANENLVNSLCNILKGNRPGVFNELNSTNKPSLLLIDNITGEGEEGRVKIQRLIQELDINSTAFFVNSKDDYCWYDYKLRYLWENIIPIVLKKRVLEKISEDFYTSLEDEVVYIYSKNKELLEMAKNINIDKELPHVGISIVNDRLTSDQEKIKMLEGILAATEKRLLYYIKKEGEK